MSISLVNMLPSNQQLIIKQTKFNYSPLGKVFEKQIKTIEGQVEKQIAALKYLKPKQQTKAIEDKSNNQSKATAIFNERINKRKELMSELYDSADYNNLGIIYEYRDSKELFNEIKNNQIKFSEVKDKQSEFLDKLSNIKIGKKTNEQKEVVDNLKKFYNSRE